MLLQRHSAKKEIVNCVCKRYDFKIERAMKSQGFQDRCNHDLDATPTSIHRGGISRSFGQSIAEVEDRKCHRKR